MQTKTAGKGTANKETRLSTDTFLRRAYLSQRPACSLCKRGRMREENQVMKYRTTCTRQQQTPLFFLCPSDAPKSLISFFISLSFTFERHVRGVSESEKVATTYDAFFATHKSCFDLFLLLPFVK